MADQSDIEAALVGLVAGVLFPGTSYAPGALQASCVSAVPPGPITASEPILARVYRGWPNNSGLLADVNAGNVNVSVYSEPGMVRNTTRRVPYSYQIAPGVPTLTATASGTLLNITGTVTPGNVVGVQFGGSSLQSAYAYAAAPGDTLWSIAAALAALIPGAVVGIPSDSGWDGGGGWDGGMGFGDDGIVFVPGAINMQGVSMMPGLQATEVRRQEAGFRISCWCPSPGARDALVSAVDLGLNALTNADGFETRFFQATQYEYAKIKSLSVYTNDYPARDRVWRRDITFLVDYPTTLFQAAPTVLFVGTTVSVSAGNSIALTAHGQTQPATSIISDGLGNVYVDAAGNLLGVHP